MKILHWVRIEFYTFVYWAADWIKHWSHSGLNRNDSALELLKEIGSGPGYPLDDCPKCDAAKKARNFVNSKKTSGL